MLYGVALGPTAYVAFASMGGVSSAIPVELMGVLIFGGIGALGVRRWPTQWRITWKRSKGPASLTLTLTLTDKKKIANWVIGGFSMGIVRGELSYDGRTWPMYGLAELIM